MVTAAEARQLVNKARLSKVKRYEQSLEQVLKDIKVRATEGLDYYVFDCDDAVFDCDDATVEYIFEKLKALGFNTYKHYNGTYEVTW